MESRVESVERRVFRVWKDVFLKIIIIIMLKNDAIIGATLSAVYFNMYPDILSGPLALYVYINRGKQLQYFTGSTEMLIRTFIICTSKETRLIN